MDLKFIARVSSEKIRKAKLVSKQINLAQLMKFVDGFENFYEGYVRGENLENNVKAIWSCQYVVGMIDGYHCVFSYNEDLEQAEMEIVMNSHADQTFTINKLSNRFRDIIERGLVAKTNEELLSGLKSWNMRISCDPHFPTIIRSKI